MRHKKMILYVIILALLLQSASCLDFSYQSKKVVLQLNLDTIVIHSKLDPVRSKLVDLHKEIDGIKKNFMRETLNKLKDKDEYNEMVKLIVGILNVFTDSVKQELADIENLFVKNDTREKRSLEILGNFLSACTGVPSARDHRKLMEQIKMLKLDSRSLANLMGESNSRQQNVIESLQIHEARISKTDQAAQINSFKLLNQVKKSIQLIATESKIVKTNEMVRNAVKAVGNAYDILEKGNSKLLSMKSIDMANLSSSLDNIYLQRRKTETSPIFSGEDSMYYQMPVTHSWAITESKEIATI